MSEPQPEYVWAFPPEKRRGGRGWLIGAIIAGVAIVALAVLLLVWRPWETAEPAPAPTATASVSPSATPTDTATPSPSPTSTPSPTPTVAPPLPPTATPPAPGDPALPVFRAKMQPLLDDASTGLSYAGESSGQEGVQLVDQLQGDAGRMSDAVAPSSIAAEWAKRVRAYGTSLDDLRTAFESGAATSGRVSAAEAALRDVQELIDG